MDSNLFSEKIPKPNGDVIHWLLDSDPAIRWQVLQYLTDAPKL